MNDLDRMKELIHTLNEAGKAYYQQNKEVMSNLEYDKMYEAHGVIGGLDVVETAAMMGEGTAGLTKRKFSKGSARSDAALDLMELVRVT